MIPQTITWVRNNVIFALNCGEKPQRGQLAAFEGFAARATSKRYGRHRERTLKIGNRWYCRDTDPVYVLETARNKKQPDIITPEEFRSVSWRRAINSLDDYEKAWILYCYGARHTYMNHMLICEYIWLQMHDRLRASRKRITDSMTGNLITLAGLMTWNAAQLISEREGAQVFASTYAAQEIGVKANSWSQNYKKHWQFMFRKCEELDSQALEVLGKLIMRKI
ncbi:bacteriophage antitermination protein Q [Salmonella enterica subsp. enterica serovar Pomona]